MHWLVKYGPILYKFYKKSSTKGYALIIYKYLNIFHINLSLPIYIS